MKPPYFRHQAITPSDVTVYKGIQALRCGGAGNLVLVDAAGTSITYAVAAGAIIEFQATKIGASSTATGIVAWF